MSEAQPAYYPPQQQYQPAAVSTGDWFVTLLLASIPIVGVILLLVWAFGGGANPSKANWAKAMLLWALVTVMLVLVFAVAMMILVSVSVSGEDIFNLSGFRSGLAMVLSSASIPA